MFANKEQSFLTEILFFYLNVRSDLLEFLKIQLKNLFLAGAKAEKVPPPAVPVGPALGGTETILLVEDEGLARTQMADELRQKGYQVLEAEDGLDALKKITDHPAPFDLLLTDIIMPRVTGLELMEEAKRIRPDQKVVLMTKYPREVFVGNLAVPEGMILVQKPISIDPLACLIRKVLDKFCA
jgi:CheY-like chemotaxis protein